MESTNSVTFQLTFLKRKSGDLFFFGQIKEILPPCQQRKPETNMVLANVFGRLSSLDLSAGQFPILNVEITHNPFLGELDSE